MESAHSSVFARDDTLFGVSAALGEDFGFNPQFLRMLFALGLFWNPAAAVVAYAGFGVLVAVARWLVPEPPHAVEARETEQIGGEADEPAREELAIAA